LEARPFDVRFNERPIPADIQSRTKPATCIGGNCLFFAGSLKKELIEHFSVFLTNCLGVGQNFEDQKRKYRVFFSRLYHFDRVFAISENLLSEKAEKFPFNLW